MNSAAPGALLSVLTLGSAETTVAMMTAKMMKKACILVADDDVDEEMVYRWFVVVGLRQKSPWFFQTPYS